VRQAAGGRKRRAEGRAAGSRQGAAHGRQRRDGPSTECGGSERLNAMHFAPSEAHGRQRHRAVTAGIHDQCVIRGDNLMWLCRRDPCR